MNLDYALEAREALRLVSLFEKYFYEMNFYCEATYEVDGVWFRWSPRVKQIQYRESLDDEWIHVARVFKMETPALMLMNVEHLFAACVLEQERVATLLKDATGAGNAFADTLASKLKEGNTDARNL